MNLGEKIKYLRKEKNLSQQEVADLLKIERATYGKWETGQFEPNKENKEKLAKIFNKSVGYFVDDLESIIMDDQFKGWYQVPLLAVIPCGFPQYSEGDVERQVWVSPLFPNVNISVYAQGDSMAPKIEHGDIVMVRYTAEPINNRVMLVETETGFTIKRIVKTKSGIELHSDNPNHPIINPRKLRVIGLVIGRQGKVI